MVFFLVFKFLIKTFKNNFLRVFIVKNKQKIIRIELGHNRFIEFNSSGIKRSLNQLNQRIE